MGRYRPPGPASSPYITREGFDKLQLEARNLWTRRREVAQALAAAAAEGDRSENAEYIYRKKELRGIDRRIGYLQRRLPALKVVDRVPADREVIFFGAWVTLEDASGKELRYRIVGPDEFDARRKWISMDAPLAQGLLKQRVGAEVVVAAPQGSARYLVLSVQYEPS